METEARRRRAGGAGLAQWALLIAVVAAIAGGYLASRGEKEVYCCSDPTGLFPLCPLFSTFLTPARV